MTLKEKLKRLVYLALQKYGIVPKNPLLYQKITQKINLCLLYEKIKNLDGAVVECGVSQGHTLAVLKIMSLAEGKSRPVYGFDTFQGLPEPGEGESGTKGEFGYSKDAVIQYFKDTQVPLEGVTLVAGDVKNTLPEFCKPIVLLHIDLDLYDGYKTTLELLWDWIVPGGIVVFDDYYHAKWGGSTRAVDEFVADHHLTLHRAEFADKCYIIKR